MTPSQNALMNDLFNRLSEDDQALCRPVAALLDELGYAPQRRKKSTFMIEFQKRGRLIAKMEIDSDGRLRFHLRFSASETYSPLFERALARRPQAWIRRGQQYLSHDIKNCCGMCKGNPRFYAFTNDQGQRILRCGGYTVWIPDIGAGELSEVLSLIKTQDKYFEELTR